MKGIIFDLDGVIVDTAKYHFLAWRALANELGIDFTEEDNERLKGVSRMASLDIILEIGGVSLTDEKKLELATKKNDRYVEYLQALKQEEVLPGILSLLQELNENGVKISLGSASKNAKFILEKLNLTSYFDAVVDGTDVSKAKPDPEVFLLGAKKLGLEPSECVIVEDAFAGCMAGKRADMFVVGIGEAKTLSDADIIFPSTKFLTYDVFKTI